MSAVLPFGVALALATTTPIDEGSACVVEAAFTNAAGVPFTPATLTYRVDDLDSGAAIVAPTAVTPGSTVSITVSGVQNALLSEELACEQHQMILTAIDGSGNEVNTPIAWQVQRIFPSTT